MNLAQVAETLGLTEDQVRIFVGQGEIPEPILIDDQVQWDEGEVVAFSGRVKVDPGLLTWPNDPIRVEGGTVPAELLGLGCTPATDDEIREIAECRMADGNF